jgi:hypothetical protein
MGTITLHGPQSAPNAVASSTGEDGGVGQTAPSSSSSSSTQNASSSKDATTTTSTAGQVNHDKDSTSSSSSSSSSSAGHGRVFLKKKDHVEVFIEGDVSSKTKNGKRQAGGSASLEGVPQSVSVDSLPSFLTRSTKTGDETRSFGFMAINKGGGGIKDNNSSSSFAMESTLSSISVIDVESEEALARRERALASETGEEGNWQEKRGGAEGLIIAELEEATAQAFDTDLNAFARLQQRDVGGEGGVSSSTLSVMKKVEEEEEVWEDA